MKGLTFAEQNALYQATQAKYAAQLENRWLDGQITDDFYAAQMASIRDALQDSTDAGWAEFQSQVAAMLNDPAVIAGNLLPSAVANNIDTVTGTTVAGNAVASIDNAASAVWDGVKKTASTVATGLGIAAGVQLLFIVGIVVLLIVFRKPLIKFFA